MKTLLKIFTNLSMASIIAVSLFTGCFDDSSDDLTIGPVESPFIICAGKNPGGVGIDLDSGTAYNIDDKADFDWDLRVKTYKGVLKNKSGKTAMSGAPFIKLQGTTVSAYQYTGTKDYDSIVSSDVVAGSLQADSVESLDMTSVDKVTQADIDADPSLAEFLGKFYYNWNTKNGLNNEYDTNLAVGDAWKTAKVMDTDHTNDPIYIIKSDENAYFKLMITDFGPDSSLKESGKIAIVWEKLQ